MSDVASIDSLRRRRGIKWTKFGDAVLAAWVADMDFDPPSHVVDAMSKMLEDGDLGYSAAVDDLPDAFVAWQQRHHGWTPDPGRIQTFTSVLQALEVVLWNCTAPGDGVVVFTPIYHPFLHAIADSGRRLVDVPLGPDGWRLDADRLAAAIDPTTRLVLLCNPHNPVGRVFDTPELAAVAEVAEQHDLLVISDEIWGDITYDVDHRVLADVAPDQLAGRLVTLGSASKSFGLAGLRCAVAHVDHPPLSERFAQMPRHLYGAPSTIGVEGTLAAWTHGDDWLADTRQRLAARRQQLAQRVADDLPGVSLDQPDGTYLAWLDFRAAGIGDDPAEWLLAHAGVALSPGPQFGTGGDGFARINFATSADILDQILDRIAEALADRTALAGDR